ncbi:MAG: plastocyanin/azurin family copper-binding protein [Paracoccaceae bacterium]
MRRSILGTVVAAVIGASAVTAALAVDEKKSVVHATLWDKGGEAMGNAMDGPMDMGMAMGGTADAAMAVVGIRLDSDTVQAGEITFEVTNASQEMMHELIVAPVADPTKPLPYSADDQRLVEETAGALGEVPETDPGKTGTLTLHLDPGVYVLFCNIPGHYAMGMWTKLTVTG